MPITNISITTGGTAQTDLTANEQRLSLRIGPTTEDCWVNFGATAAVNAGFLIPNGGSENFNSDEHPDIKKYISIRSATTAAKISILEGSR